MLERILRENKERRAPKTEFIGLQGNEWRIEGFGSNSNIYHDEGKMSQAVTVQRCIGSVINLPRKCAHVMLNDLKSCKVRIKAVLTTVEVVHCDNLVLVIQGDAPVVQIDLCKNVEIQLVKEALERRPKIVNASNMNVTVQEGSSGGHVEVIPTSMFGEQYISFWKRGADGQHSFQTQTTSDLKSSHGGYVEIAGVSGSTQDLLDMEEKQQQDRDKQNGHKGSLPK